VQAFNAMSIRDRVAVDGSALQMDQRVSPPESDPMPGNKVDPKVGQNILKAIAPLASDAEFPLRKTLATPNTTVFTNHFEIKLDPKMQLTSTTSKGYRPG
jgi:eukaryotic translation initiation factor 2C